jgi:hypothetical protein
LSTNHLRRRPNALIVTGRLPLTSEENPALSANQTRTFSLGSVNKRTEPTLVLRIHRHMTPMQ